MNSDSTVLASDELISSLARTVADAARSHARVSRALAALLSLLQIAGPTRRTTAEKSLESIEGGNQILH